MGTPIEKTAPQPRETLDQVLHRLASMVAPEAPADTGKDTGATVEESVRRLEARAPRAEG